jgi:hypothetical protein
VVRIENHCCDCAVPGYPCLGEACSRRHVRVFYCDKCITKRQTWARGDGEYPSRSPDSPGCQKVGGMEKFWVELALDKMDLGRKNAFAT